MKKNNYLVLLLILLVACTIQKRTVNRGYFVQWHFKLKSDKKKELKDSVLMIKVEKECQHLLTFNEKQTEDESSPLELPVLKSFGQDNTVDNNTDLVFEKKESNRKRVNQISRKLKKKEEPKGDEKPDKSKRKVLFLLVALILAIVFLTLTLTFPNFVLFRLLNIIFALAFWVGLITFWKDIKTRLSHLTQVRNIKNQKAGVTISMILSLVFFITSLVVLVWLTLLLFIEDIFLTVFIFHIMLIFSLLFFLISFNHFRRLRKYTVDLEEKTKLKESYRRRIRSLLIIFLIIGVLFIGFLLYLFSL